MQLQSNQNQIKTTTNGNQLQPTTNEFRIAIGTQIRSTTNKFKSGQLQIALQFRIASSILEVNRSCPHIALLPTPQIGSQPPPPKDIQLQKYLNQL